MLIKFAVLYVKVSNNINNILLCRKYKASKSQYQVNYNFYINKSSSLIADCPCCGIL